MDMKDYLRSPRETMLGWVHLPRYIDKIRLFVRDELTADYLPNLGKGFDGKWLQAAGINHEQMVEQVKGSISDGQVAQWVRQNAKADKQVVAAFNQAVLSFPSADDAEYVARLQQRKAEAGLEKRDDIRTFVDFIDAEEGRI